MKTNTLKKGAVGGLMALTLMTAVPVPTAQAATFESLQAQIQSLMAKLAALNSTTTITCSPFATDLTIGRSGATVTELQKFLIARGHTIPAGATGYYGEQTRAAVAQFQSAHNITPAVGYFGPMTRAKANSLCTVTVTPPPTDSGTTTPPTTPLGGEGTIERFALDNEDDTIEEGDENVPVANISFDVEDGDITINRIDVGFTPNTLNDEQDPWDTFDEVSIWDGNTRIAKINASNDRAWKEDSPTNGSHTLRFSGLSHRLNEDTEAELTVKVTTKNSIKGIQNGESWKVFIPTNGIRALDADKVSTYGGDTNETIDLTLEEAGAEDELVIRPSDQDLDTTTLQLKDNARSGYTTVFAFDIDTDDSTRDIEIRKLPIELTVSSSTVGTFMHNARITIDGKTFTKKVIVDGASSTVTFEFSKGQVVIDAGDRVTAIVEVDFKALPALYEGTTIEASVDAATIIAKGADDLTSSQLNGTASSETHTLRTTGIIVTADSLTSTVSSISGALNDYATHEIELEVTAFGQDVYIPTTATSGITYQFEDGSGDVINATSSAVLASNAREIGGYFRILDGETKTLTLSVVLQPAIAMHTARLQLLSIEFNDTASAPTQNWTAVPPQHFETPTKTIVD
jgi:peptidoglycan hydrolase-like protein with peptidoglycan-binding domain